MKEVVFMNTQYEAFKKDTNYTKEGFPVILDRYTSTYPLRHFTLKLANSTLFSSQFCRNIVVGVA